MNRIYYVLKRIVQSIFLLWLTLSVLWIGFRMLPGTYTDLLLLGGSSPETVAAIEAQWGLNDPMYVQYIRFLTNYLTLDAGTSFQFRRPVADLVLPRVFNSFILVAPAITLSYILGGVIGAVLGNARGSKLERRGLVPIILFGSVPSFFLAIVAIIIFSGHLDLVPSSGMLSFETTRKFADAAWWRPYFTQDFLKRYVLPFSVILIRYLYLPVMLMRTSIVEVKDQGSFFYHRITGLPYTKRLRHLIKHASLPIITMYPVSMTRALGGLVLVEFVFNWPGIGFTLVKSIFARDYPVVTFIFFLIALFIILANFTIDLLYGYIDPRVSISEQ